ncbi:glycoside hydrolase family 57 protein [Thermovibrio sp.]
MKGYFTLVLHHHLPFVKHPEYDYFHEENWLFEAVSEVYVPLIKVFRKLREERVKVKAVVSLTPPLCEMLSDPLLKRKFEKFLERSIELAYKEVERTKGEPKLNALAKMYLERFKEVLKSYQELSGEVLKAYGELQSEGVLEIITCGATHGLLPALQSVPESVRTQIRVAVKNYEKHFGSLPKGIWLPECGYYPEVEKELKRFGIERFYLDTHGLLFGKPTPKYGVYSGVKTLRGLFAFGRDQESTRQVWSAKEGYPGDPWYRDFYRDIGFDLPLDYVKPYINPDGTRTYTGFKYHRITGEVDLGKKEIYDREKALERVKVHSENFHFNRAKQVEYLKGVLGIKPLIVAPFDAELFGHWWFEGPQFLYHLFKAFDRYRVIEPITSGEYLERERELPVSQPTTSSWGDRGYFDVWVNGENDWIYYHLTAMALKLNGYKEKFSPTPFNTRILNQMLRELLLAQSSDWPFLITTKTAREYAERRLKEHITNFKWLSEALERGKVEEEKLRKVEEKNSIFQEINFWEDWG